MNKLLFQICVSLLVVSLWGCVAPGSSMGLISIDGTLTSGLNEPVANTKIEIILPAEYGLGGLDLVMNNPEDFGHNDEKFSVVTNSDGSFHYEIGKRIYHITCWLLPPVGCYPKRPPAPFLLLQLTDNPEEHYFIETYNGEFKVYSLGVGEIPLEESNLIELDADNEAGSDPDTRETVGKIRLRLKSD